MTSVNAVIVMTISFSPLEIFTNSLVINKINQFAFI